MTEYKPLNPDFGEIREMSGGAGMVRLQVQPRGCVLETGPPPGVEDGPELVRRKGIVSKGELTKALVILNGRPQRENDHWFVRFATSYMLTKCESGVKEFKERGAIRVDLVSQEAVVEFRRMLRWAIEKLG